MLPIAQYGFELSKQQSRDSICLRYGWKTQNCQRHVHVEANLIYNIMWVLKKGGFVNIRHNDLRDLTTKILSEVCYDTEIEPTLVLLSAEYLSNWNANRSNEARLDVRAHGFWEKAKQTFFDWRALDPNACRYLNKLLQHCHVINENEKKRTYNKRVLHIDHDTFTPLVFSIYGKMKIWVESATSFSSDYQIYYQRNVIYQSQ